MSPSHVCHEHNLSHPVPRERRFGVRVGLRPGDPFSKLVGQDWHREHWYATEREREDAFADMSARHAFSRIGDEPALVFERVERS